MFVRVKLNNPTHLKVKEQGLITKGVEEIQVSCELGGVDIHGPHDHLRRHCQWQPRAGHAQVAKHPYKEEARQAVGLLGQTPQDSRFFIIIRSSTQHFHHDSRCQVSCGLGQTGPQGRVPAMVLFEKHGKGAKL